MNKSRPAQKYLDELNREATVKESLTVQWKPRDNQYPGTDSPEWVGAIAITATILLFEWLFGKAFIDGPHHIFRTILFSLFCSGILLLSSRDKRTGIIGFVLLSGSFFAALFLEVWQSSQSLHVYIY